MLPISRIFLCPLLHLPKSHGFDAPKSQFPITPFERSRWRGGRFACYTPRVMLQRGVLIQRFRFRLILATAFNSVNYSQKSIQIP
jgi:hypothetical protein